MTSSLKKLLPEIKARREEIEEARRLPQDIARSLQKAGVWASSAPKSVGGDEQPLADTMRVIETVAAADGSAGWCTMIGSNMAAGYMNEVGAKEIFTDPTAPKAGIAAPIGAATRVDGGFKISGRWPFASGVTHCDWGWFGCLVMGENGPVMTPHGPEIIHAFIPISNIEIHDTWYVSGLRGTGSNDVSATDIFVPEHHVFSLFDPSGHRPEPLYQLPVVGAFVSTVAAVGLGIAREAIDEILELAGEKKPAMSMLVLADKPAAQIELARAEGALGGARSFLYDTVEDLWQTVSAGREPTMRQIALNRIAASQAADTSATVARTVAHLGGSSALYKSSSLARHARDTEALTHHFTVSAHTWEDAGRVLLGRTPTAPIF